jgi:sulfite oxidase
VKLAPGSYTIASRVTDVLGNQQAECSMENAGGYNNTSWRDHALKITAV